MQQILYPNILALLSNSEVILHACSVKTLLRNYLENPQEIFSTEYNFLKMKAIRIQLPNIRVRRGCLLGNF